ncbi:unnamed protein product [Rotaria sp. Silwood2]|nr:unnamed protein product [Rotaria sp. Silwood2]
MNYLIQQQKNKKLNHDLHEYVDKLEGKSKVMRDAKRKNPETGVIDCDSAVDSSSDNESGDELASPEREISETSVVLSLDEGDDDEDGDGSSAAETSDNDE